MPLNFFQRRKILKNLNFLDIIPVRLHKHIINGDSNLVIKKLVNFAFLKINQKTLILS